MRIVCNNYTQHDKMVSATHIPSPSIHGYEKQAAIAVFVAFVIWWILKLLANIATSFLRNHRQPPSLIPIDNSNVDVAVVPVASGAVVTNSSIFSLRRYRSSTGGYDRQLGHYHTRTQDAQSLAHAIFTSLGITLLFVFLAQKGIPHVIHHIMWTALGVGELAVLSNLLLGNRLFGVPLILAFIGLLISIWSLGVLR